MQRWLLKNRFKRGAKSENIGLKPYVIAWRNSYLWQNLDNRAKSENEKLQEVYLDESYIHQHCFRHEDSIYDSNNEQDNQMRNPNKGRQICFIPARSYKCGENNSCMVLISVWHFIPGEKQYKGDHSKAFNGKIFIVGSNHDYFRI